MEFAFPQVAERAMIVNTIAEKLKGQLKDDFKGRNFEHSCDACATRSAIETWKGCFASGGSWSVIARSTAGDLAYAPMAEKRLWQFRRFCRDAQAA